jgi:CDP-diacylglycerol---glycerol-3-phosphate 3-phosphatidyltransferase
MSADDHIPKPAFAQGSGKAVQPGGGEYNARKRARTGCRRTTRAGLRFMNLPNTLTVSRIFFVPLLVVVVLTKFERELISASRANWWRPRSSGSRRSPTGSTATWRGGAARSRPLGQMMDPIADKLLTSAAFISLVQIGLAPAWMVAVIIGRELAVTYLRSLASSRAEVVSRPRRSAS